MLLLLILIGLAIEHTIHNSTIHHHSDLIDCVISFHYSTQ